MVIAAQLLLGCEDVHELDGIMRNLTAADAWAAGAIIFSAATGDRLAQEGPRSWDYTEDDFHVARLAYLQQVHMEWKVGLCSACLWSQKLHFTPDHVADHLFLTTFCCACWACMGGVQYTETFVVSALTVYAYMPCSNEVCMTKVTNSMLVSTLLMCMSILTCLDLVHASRAAWYITRLLIKLTPKGVVFSFLFLSFLDTSKAGISCH